MFLSCSILKKQLSKLQQNFCIIQLSFTMSIHPSSCPLRYLSIHPSGCPIRYISIHPAFLQDIFSSIQLSFKIFCSFIYIDNSSPLICIFYLSIHPSLHQAVHPGIHSVVRLIFLSTSIDTPHQGRRRVLPKDNYYIWYYPPLSSLVWGKYLSLSNVHV